MHLKLRNPAVAAEIYHRVQEPDGAEAGAGGRARKLAEAELQGSGGATASRVPG